MTEILQNIRQSEMTPMLQRMFQSDGGSEICDVLMKYLYKGMAQGTTAGHGGGAGRNTTPQSTGGFSQMGGRSFGGAEGGGQAMSVLLSWHEKASGVPYVRHGEGDADARAAGRTGRAGKHREGHGGPEDCVSRPV